MRFRPQFYLTDSWGCPNEVPAIGIPFYLADKRLSRLEEEQTGEVEDEATAMMFLRHEAGHAVNYAYRLWEDPEWKDVFGAFSQPYRDHFQPQQFSRQFVRHVFSSSYGRTYAQKHPDEDFAETFAVWLTPHSGWRRKYRYWPVLEKLKYVHAVMRRIRNEPPKCTEGKLLNPVQRMRALLMKHYGDRAERHKAAAEGYVDGRLRDIFPAVRGRNPLPVADLLAKYRQDLLERMLRWSDLEESEANAILDKLETRCRALNCMYVKAHVLERVVDLASLATALAMELAYTGRLMG